MSKKTVEEICICRTQGDLWKELNSKPSLNTIVLHTFLPNTNYIIRFLGPFIKAKRLYTGGLKPFIDEMDLSGIINGNKESLEKAQKLINDHFGTTHKTYAVLANPDNLHRNPYRNRREDHLFADSASKDPSTEARSQLMKMFGRDKYWQNCILVNAMCESYYQGSQRNTLDANIKVVTLAPSICDRIGVATSSAGSENCRINGVFAHSIQMSKAGHGLQSQYNISLLPEENMCQAHINKIMFEGLYDIPTVAKSCNRRKYPFLYKVEPDYKMADKFVISVLEEHKKFEENKHIHSVEDHINDIPAEAFERRNDMISGIDSLEV